tara:strand:+ start:325 stop:1197 length:873 start_codon:yes stop_codon:yes gene_type:complete
MLCSNCSNNNFEYLSDTSIVCTSCGYIENDPGDNKLEFANDMQYNRCVEHQLQKESVIKEYMKYLNQNKSWSDEDFNCLQEEISVVLDSKHPCNEKSLILAVVLKYASKRNIPCDISFHKRQIGSSSKELGKALRFINGGVISEGICNVDVKRFINVYGDTGIVRPNSMLGEKGHELTKELGQYIQENVGKSTEYCSESACIDKLINMFSVDNKFINVKMRDVWCRLSRSDLYENEGEVMTALITAYIVSSEYNLIKNTREFCLKTRLTSVPTLQKIRKRYSDIIEMAIK